jgi:hypothetical protein
VILQRSKPQAPSEEKKPSNLPPQTHKIRLFSKIQLRGFKRSLISAARPNKLGGSEDEVNEILEIRFDQKV